MTRARRTKLMLDAGPYRVESHASGKLTVHPNWPPWKDDSFVSGPGVLERLDLAADIERFLNGGARHPSREKIG